jgi:hypothetical protein
VRISSLACAATLLLTACGAITGLDDFPNLPDAAQTDGPEPSVDGAADTTADRAADAAGEAFVVPEAASDASESSMLEAGTGEAGGSNDAGGANDAADANDATVDSDAADASGATDAAEAAVACTASEPGDYANWHVSDVPQQLVQNADGTITDDNTGLTWMKAPAGEADGGTEIYATSFAAAEAACPCPWRLPQRIELASIIDYGRYYMALNPLFFTNVADGNTAWTATTFVPTSAWWFVDFVEGSPSGPYDGDVAGQVRCVRGTTHPPAVRYTLQTSDAGVAEVVDNGTGLTWKQQSEPGMLGWDAAFAQCTAPYRMPTISELSTLVDSSRSKPAIDITVFSDTGSSWYLTSSAVSYVYLGGNYWYIDFTTGSADYTGNNWSGDPYQVRCVR